jgi:hypothetical protein
MSNPFENITELSGAIHLHTSYSDGGIDFPELIGAAREVGLDFIVVTDHMTLDAKKAGYEGFSGDLFVAIGYEHHDRHNRNHYLALGPDRIASADATPQEYINYVNSLGGVGFLAHPMEQRNYFKKLPPYPWTEWDAQGYDGVEIWNQMSDWMEHLKNWRSFIRILFPRRFMSDSPSLLLKRWDALNRNRFVSGIGGVDAHTRRFDLGLTYLTIFPIKVELKGIRTHLYLDTPLPRDDSAGAVKILMDALRRGRGFVANFRRGDARGSRFYIADAKDTVFLPGRNQQKAALPAKLHAELKERAEMLCYRNGRVIDRQFGPHACFPISATGVYRVEVRKEQHAWIYSNPFPIGSYPL